MIETWRPLAAYPDYEISTAGSIRSFRTRKMLTPTFNQQGYHKVKLRFEGADYTRQVNQLVAEAFLPPPPRRDFVSVIHLDGDKTNNHFTNLMWRPKYFATRYYQQFRNPAWHQWRIPVIDVKSGRTYETVQLAAVEHGLIFTEILTAAHLRTIVWPTYQEYRTLSDSD